MPPAQCAPRPWCLALLKSSDFTADATGRRNPPIRCCGTHHNEHVGAAGRRCARLEPATDSARQHRLSCLTFEFPMHGSITLPATGRNGFPSQQINPPCHAAFSAAKHLDVVTGHTHDDERQLPWQAASPQRNRACRTRPPREQADAHPRADIYQQAAFCQQPDVHPQADVREPDDAP